MSERTKKGKSRKPKRPMTAYNFFFRDEHARIRDQLEADDVAAEEAEIAKAEADGTEPPAKKKRRKKISPREKLGFEDLGKLIGQRWRDIDPEELAKYKKLASKDSKRYKKESEDYYKGQINSICLGYNVGKNGKGDRPDASAAAAAAAVANSAAGASSLSASALPGMSGLYSSYGANYGTNYGANLGTSAGMMPYIG